jgi:hypothetical protein
MACLVAIPDDAMGSLDDFRKRHAGCARDASGLGADPGDPLSYSYIPSSLGGIAEATCRCGARWAYSPDSGEPYEVPAPMDDRPAGSAAVTHAVRALHLALVRPGVVLGCSGERAVHEAESFWRGLAAGLFRSEGGETLDRIVMEWTSALYEELGTDERIARHSDAYLAAGMGWREVLDRWDALLLAYMWRKFPDVAREASLPYAE